MTAASIVTFLQLFAPMLSTLEGEGYAEIQAEIAKISDPTVKQVVTDIVTALQPVIVAELAKV